MTINFLPNHLFSISKYGNYNLYEQLNKITTFIPPIGQSLYLLGTLSKNFERNNNYNSIFYASDFYDVQLHLHVFGRRFSYIRMT